jgi:hypothetical protein
MRGTYLAQEDLPVVSSEQRLREVQEAKTKAVSLWTVGLYLMGGVLAMELASSILSALLRGRR